MGSQMAFWKGAYRGVGAGKRPKFKVDFSTKPFPAPPQTLM